jgi:hypothetical protein
MGKKSVVKVAKKSVLPTKTTPSSSSASSSSSAKSESKYSTDSDKKPESNIMDQVESLLHELENLVDIQSPEAERTKQRILQQLLEDYKQIAIKNKIDSKREEMLSNEINEIERKTEETSNELKELKESYYNSEIKIEKLEKLSNILNSRIKSIECKATEDIKAEKGERLQMSYDFSGKIKDISTKLDELGKKREQIITENGRLKEILKHCLEEYDKEQQIERLQTAAMEKELSVGIIGEEEEEHQEASSSAVTETPQEKNDTNADNENATNNSTDKNVEKSGKDEENPSNNNEEGTVVTSSSQKLPSKNSLVTSVMNAILSGNPTEIANALSNDKEIIALENRLKDETTLMEIEDNLSKLSESRYIEYQLRHQVTRFMEVFDSFQIRLSKSNNQFKEKQTKVEELTKEMRLIEKANYDLSQRINECNSSTKVVMESIDKILNEKEKLLKMSEKQRSLIDKFQKDINKMNSLIDEPRK